MRNKGLSLAYPNIKDTFDKIPFDSNTILHNDNGSEYTSNKMKALIKKLGIKHSFTKPGTGFQDNSIVEYLFSILKEKYLFDYYNQGKSLEEWEKICEIIKDDYNNVRFQGNLQNKTPHEYAMLNYNVNIYAVV